VSAISADPLSGWRETPAKQSIVEFVAACRSWLASARHPRFGRPYPAMVYQPMLELLDLDRHGR
jgi:hypothetical protein